MTILISLVVAMLVSMTGCSNATTEVGQSSEQSSSPTSSPPVSVIETASLNENATEGQSNMANSTTLILKAIYESFQAPTGIAVDKDGNLYVSNWSGSTVTKVDTKGNHSVFADGMGSPAGLAFDEGGNLYITDYSKDVIYKITPDGVKNTFVRDFIPLRD